MRSTHSTGALALFVVVTLLLRSCVVCEELQRGRHDDRTAPIIQKRCRSTSDLERIPKLLNTSTFHNFGYPLIKSLCESNNNHHGSSLTSSSSSVSTTTNDALSNECKRISKVTWSHGSEKVTRSGPHASMIVVDPHVMDNDGTESSGGFVLIAMYSLFHELGYRVGIRHWSSNLNKLFSEEVTSAAVNISAAYDTYIERKGPNPFQNELNHVAFTVEVGPDMHVKPKEPINNSPYARQFRWIIGLQQSSHFKFYELKSEFSHCIGANIFLGQGLFCSTSGVINTVMFPYHRKKSLQVTDKNRAKLKENIVIIDHDARSDFDINRLQADIRKLGGVDDVQVLLHFGRAREEVPELYMKTKVSLDCRNPGLEYINLEAVLYDVLTLSCDSRATRNVFDFPVPSRYRFETSRYSLMVKKIHSLLVNYTDHVPEFRTFKRYARSSHRKAAVSLDVHMFSRDVLFRLEDFTVFFKKHQT